MLQSYSFVYISVRAPAPLASESLHILFLPPENPFPPVHGLPFPSALPWCSVDATTQTYLTEHKSEP